MCYGMLALATDYDCWKDDGEDVNVEAVLATKSNSETLRLSLASYLTYLLRHRRLVLRRPNLPSSRHEM